MREATSSGSTVYYFAADHLGSTSVTLDAYGTKIGEMKYMPFGETRYTWGGTPTDRHFTGQREENGLGSLYDYGARMYSPVLGRFLSADSIVPGAASGSGGGAATLGYDSSSRLTTLTTDFHEFIGKVTQENQAVLQYGPFFQWSEKVRKDNPVPSGPLNPQALNRYSYVLNNPLRYVDPTGHDGEVEFGITFNKPEDIWYLLALVRTQKQYWYDRGALAGGGAAAAPSVAGYSNKLVGVVSIPLGAYVGYQVGQGAGAANAAGFEQLQAFLEHLQVGSTLDVNILEIRGKMYVNLSITGDGHYRHMRLDCENLCSAAGFANIMNVFITTDGVWMDAKSGKGINLAVIGAKIFPDR